MRRREPALRTPAQGFAIPQGGPLARDGYLIRWAPVLTATKAREYSSFRGLAIAPVSTRTPDGTTNLVVAIRELTGDGTAWVQARLATLPNGRLGWVPRSALGGWEFVDTRVAVDRARLSLTPYPCGTSARSPYETGWPAGGFIGIHGTGRPGLIPGRISRCIRLNNAAILRLARLMPVGTPVTVQ